MQAQTYFLHILRFRNKKGKHRESSELHKALLQIPDVCRVRWRLRHEEAKCDKLKRNATTQSVDSKLSNEINRGIQLNDRNTKWWKKNRTEVKRWRICNVKYFSLLKLSSSSTNFNPVRNPFCRNHGEQLKCMYRSIHYRYVCYFPTLQAQVIATCSAQAIFVFWNNAKTCECTENTGQILANFGPNCESFGPSLVGVLKQPMHKTLFTCSLSSSLLQAFILPYIDAKCRGDCCLHVFDFALTPKVIRIFRLARLPSWQA